MEKEQTCGGGMCCREDEEESRPARWFYTVSREPTGSIAELSLFSLLPSLAF